MKEGPRSRRRASTPVVTIAAAGGADEMYPREDATAVLLAPRRPRVKSPTLADRVANSTIVHLSWKWHEAAKDFPSEPWMRHVNRYYPQAEGGPLAIDMENQTPAAALDRREKAVRARGIRYIRLSPSEKLEEVLIRLAQIDAELAVQRPQDTLQKAC